MSNADIPTVASPKIHRLNKLVPLHSLSESINRDRHILHKFALSKIEIEIEYLSIFNCNLLVEVLGK